jgi:demethylmenaquinone methyltransferase/2-methoxy-6-polyprenyl-1,4-benzoquinol methylase
MMFALAKTGRIKHLSGCDISGPMLEIAGRKRYDDLDGVSLDWICASAEKTGLADSSFDLVTCAFGLRNVDDVQAAVCEMYRLLRPGGRVCVLEFFLPSNRILRGVYRFYLGRVMPILGKYIAGSDGPWRYLAESIQEWADANCLTGQLQRAGFEVSEVRLLTFGTVQIHLAVKK